MIECNELVKIGNSHKPHGIKGDISFSFINNYFLKSNSKNSFFVFELNGIFVPFKVESYRFISNSVALVKLKNINAPEQANLLAHQEVFSLQKQLEENTESNSLKKIFSLNYFIGFSIIEEKMGKIGSIIDIDKSTINILFIVERGKKEILIPIADEMIITIDKEQKIIYMKFPVGLL